MRATAPWPRLERWAGVGLLAALSGLPTPASAALATRAAADSPSASAALEAVAVGLVLNGAVVADSQLVHLQGTGRAAVFWLPLEQARGWRMDVRGRAVRSIEGVVHAAFCDGRDRCLYDDSSALLNLVLQPQDLQPLRVEPARRTAPPLTDPDAVGGWLNYDVSAWHIGGPGLALQLDGRSYTPHGQAALRLDGIYSAGRGRRTALAALWQVDKPEAGWSAQFGSVGVTENVFSANLPLLGLHLGSNARLQPMLPTTLRPLVVVPAADRALRADVFVDGLYRQTAEVAYGPYSVEVQPTQPGRGQIDIVSTDARGVQTRSSLPFYQATQLLAPGVTEWSLDAGWLQDRPQDRPQIPARRLGVVSAGLGRALDRMATLHLQTLAGDRTLRVAAAVDTAHPRWGLSSVSVIAQRTPTQPQGQAWIGLAQEYLSRTGSIGVRAERAVQGCAGLAAGVPSDVAADPLSDRLSERLMRPCQRLSATAGADIDARWSVSAALQAQRESQGRRTALSALALRLQTGGNSQLSLSLQSLQLGAVRSRQVQLSLTLPLSPQWQGQVGAQQRSGADTGLNTAAQWSMQTVAPAGEAAAQRTQVYGSVGAQPDLGLRHAARAAQLDWRAEGHADNSGRQASAGVSGAIGYAGGRVFATRRIDDAFVLVEVGLPDLPVLLDNREVARTNAAGWAVVTEARAHQPNVVGVDTAALPIEYSMPRDQQDVVPGTNAGVVLRFDLSDGGIALVVRDEAGGRLPTGAVVQVSSQRLPTAVTSLGEVFVDRSDRAANVEVQFSSRSCRFRYDPQNAVEVHRCVAA